MKVLDFGLAKLAHPEAAAGHADVTASPTITSPAMMTGVGVLLGTAAYMSPEQAKGREADKRSDIWAFGCVLYEMLTGRRAFDGEDMTDVLGAVVRLEPDWEALPSDVPPPVRTLLQRCLVKDRRKRIADIAAALFVLDHQAGVAATRHGVGSAAATQTAVAARRGTDGRCAGGRRRSRRRCCGSPRARCRLRVVRTTITTSGSAALTLQGADRDVAITPDGSRVVYRGNNQLLVRALNQLEPTVLSGLGAPQGVFISPDGQWVGFFDGATIKKVAITGGPPVTCARRQGGPRGATWGPDGTIIFATNTPATGLQRVSAAGGEPTVLTKPDRERGEGDHLWPEFLPGGEAVLFTITPATGSIENAQIAVLDLRTGTSKVLIRGGSHAHYVPTGHLVYGVAGTLRAVAFDLGRLEVVGTPAPVLEGVVTTGSGAADVAVAANGSLVYVPGGAGGGGQQTVVSVDRQGRASPLPGLPLGLVPRRPGVARRRAARARHPDGCLDLRFCPRNAEPADDRPGAGPQPALDARRAAHHLYVEPSGLPRAVLAAGGWHRQRRAAPRACEGSHRSARQRLVGRRQTAPVYRGVAEPVSARSGRSPSSARPTRRCW